MYLTIDEILASAPKLTEDEILIDMKNANAPLQPIPEVDLDEFENLDLCERWNEWRANRRDNMRNASKSRKMHKIKGEINKTRLMRKMKIDKAISSVKDVFVNMWNELKGYAIKLWEDAKLYYHSVINYFKSNFQKICLVWKKLKRATTAEEKATRKLEIRNLFKKFGGDVAEMFGIYVIVDYAKAFWNILKNIWGISKNKWKSIIASFRDTESILNEYPEIKNSKRTGIFVNILTIVTPLLAQLGTIILALIDCYKAEQTSCEEYTNSILANNGNVQKVAKNIDISDIINHLNNSNNSADINEQNDTISICPVPDNNVSNNFINENGGYILSIDDNIQKYSLNVKVDQHINYGDIIGYINNSPIKSEISGRVAYIGHRNLLIINDIFNDEINIEDEIANMNIMISNEQNNATLDNNDIMRIGNALKEMNDVEEIIRNNYNLFSSIIMNGNAIYDNLSDNIFRDSVNSICNENNKIINKYENEITNICSSSNIKAHAEKNELDKIKTNIQDKKYNFIDDAYNRMTGKDKKINTQKKYANSIDAYNLCDTLLTFFTTNIDENNKLLCDLDDIITDMYVTRFNYEKHNINNLINTLDAILKDAKINYTYTKLFSTIYTYSDKDTLNFFYKIFGVKTYTSSDINAENISEEEQQRLISESQKEIKEITARKNLAYYAYKIFKLIIKIKEIKTANNPSNKNLMQISNIEANKIINYIIDIYNKHKNNRRLVDDIENIFDFIGWPTPSLIHINNGEYQHYVFSEDDNKNIITADDDILSSTTSCQLSEYKYWLKYCTMATLVNCSMPLYWATGFVAAGAPILFPIILIPIKYIPGKIGTLIGLGICGIMVYPMVIMMNMTVESHSCLIPVNNIIDRLRDMLKNAEKLQIKSISKSLKSDIDVINKKINNIEQDIRSIKNEILLVKSL